MGRSPDLQPAHSIDKRQGKSPRGHHHKFEGYSVVTPNVRRETFDELAVKIPATTPAPEGFKETQWFMDSSGHPGQSIDLQAYSPEVRQPLTPVFTYRRGKSVGGGGTSNEALHRARRKLRQNHK